MPFELMEAARRITRAVSGVSFYWTDDARALAVRKAGTGTTPHIVYRPPLRGQPEIRGDLDAIIDEMRNI